MIQDGDADPKIYEAIEFAREVYVPHQDKDEDNDGAYRHVSLLISDEFAQAHNAGRTPNPKAIGKKVGEDVRKTLEWRRNGGIAGALGARPVQRFKPIKAIERLPVEVKPIDWEAIGQRMAKGAKPPWWQTQWAVALGSTAFGVAITLIATALL